MNDEYYMRRAIELAKKGAGWVNPNPMVGAVIVRDDRIIGEGYHRKCGELHAERNAFASLTEPAEGATIYVTLEPCCHYGKTPPCTEAIIENGIRRVVIGSRDPNPLVAGKGARLLRKKGILVEEDFLREECDALNPVFFHYITTGKPYGVMKYAMTLDGKIATRTGASKWITGEKAREHVHTLRGRYAAILAGIGTVLADDPMLNCRLDPKMWADPDTEPHQPLRVIVDSRLRIPEDAMVCRTAGEIPTLVASAVDFEKNSVLCRKKERLEKMGVTVQVFSGADSDGSRGEDSGKERHPQVDLAALTDWLGEQKIDSILIEGGGQIHEAALHAGIVDHVCAYVAPKIFGGSEAKSPVEGRGIELPDQAFLFCNLRTTMLGEDILLEYDKNKI